MNEDEIKAILKNHALWLNDNSAGERAVLRWADLRGANLSGSDLIYSDLRYSDLRGSDLIGADLRYSDLRCSDLRGSDLRGADLSGADLRGSRLIGSDLSEENLSVADLIGATDGNVCRMDFGGWSIYIRDATTIIGCKEYLNQEWLSFSPDDVASFATGAKEWWELRGDAVKAAIRSVMKDGMKEENNGDAK